MGNFARFRAALVVCVVVVVASLAMSATAGAVDFTNACRNSAVGTNWDQVNVSLSGASSPSAVSPGDAVTLSNISQTVAVPGAIFVAGYNLGLLTVGQNNIPATLHSVIDGSNTVQGSQSTNNVDTTLSTTISDPDGTPGSGDESATDASATVAFADQTWTAGASGTIGFREHRDDNVTGVAGGGLIAVAHLAGGLINVQFHCTPGTVTGSNPGVPSFFDAPNFATTQINDAPTASAGADQTVDSGQTVNLDGTGSSDPNGDALTYAWTQTSGPGVTLSGANTATPSFTAPTGPATLTFQLQVCDPFNACSTDSVTVTVRAPNNTPVASAGADQTVNSGASVSLDGTGSSDPDGDALTYAWTQTSGPNVTLSGANTATPSFTAPTGPATLTFQLQVCDPFNACSTDSVTITVNGTPTANAGADQTVVSGATVSLNGTASSDPDGDALTYAWTQTAGPNVTLSGADTATPSFTAPAVAPGSTATLTFQLQVCDTHNACSTDSVTITVIPMAVIDGSMNAIVSGPTRTAAGDKTVVAKVTNLGTDVLQVCDTDISWAITVNGTPTTGTVSAKTTGCKTLTPGGSARFRFLWTFGTGEVSPGATVVYTATVTVAGDVNNANNSDTETRTAK